MMDIRAILLDFDGTSLQRDQVYISFRNKRALLDALDRGVEIIPCTGRCEDMFPPQIEAEKRIRYWVTANGARVVDRQKKRSSSSRCSRRRNPRCSAGSLKTGTSIRFDRQIKTSLDKGTQRKTTENELPSLTQCTA